MLITTRRIMNHSNYSAGVWAKEWAGLEKSNVFGTANLVDDGIILDIPCGSLLGGLFSIYSNGQSVASTDYLYGYTCDNQFLVLRDAAHMPGRETVPGLPRERIRAKELFAARGHQFDVTRKVAKMIVFYSGLTEWFHRTAFQSTLNPETYIFESLKYDKEMDKVVTLYEGPDISIVVGSRYSFPTPHVSEMVFSHQNSVMVSFIDGQGVTEAVSFAKDFSRFLSLCMGSHAGIESIKLLFEGDEFWVDYFKKMRNPSESEKYDVQLMPLPYAAIADQLPALIGSWLNDDEGMGDNKTFAYLKYAAELVVSVLMYNWDMPVQPLYASAAQALEALARYEAKINNRLNSLSSDVYKSYMNQLRFLIKGGCDSFRSWVTGHFHGNEKGMRRLIKDLYEAHADLVGGLIPDVDSFRKLQLDLRNRCSHPVPNGEDDLETVWFMTQSVALVSEVIIWSYLGLEPSTIQARLKVSRYKLSVIWWIGSRFGCKV